MIAAIFCAVNTPETVPTVPLKGTWELFLHKIPWRFFVENAQNGGL